ncbi:MAG: sensor histidine kinase [Leptothrix sp. (in: b-proteobacteria)]
MRRLLDALAELSERLRAASTEREESLERQRARAAGDLHDGLGSLLTGVKLHLELLGSVLSGAAASMPGDARSPASRVVRLGERVDVAVGLVAALGWLAEDFQLCADVAYELRVDDPLQRPAAVERSVMQKLFCLTQEALAQVARHAAARQVRIDGQALHLSIRDDGVGFDPHSAPCTGRDGRLGMGELFA